MRHCSVLLLQSIALHPRYDHSAMAIPGFSPAPFSVQSKEACARLCAEHTACAGWTFRGGSEPSCWLVSKVGKATSKAGAQYVSGRMCRNNDTNLMSDSGKRINQCVVSKYSSFEDVDEAPPAIELACGKGAVFTKVAFASYGRPLGLCLPDGRTLTGMRPLRQTKCHAKDSMELVEKACLNKPSCVVSLAHNNRRKNKSSDPCPGKVKRLAVKMECSIEYHPDTESILSSAEEAKPPLWLAATQHGYSSIRGHTVTAKTQTY